jgi:hypothetical protein
LSLCLIVKPNAMKTYVAVDVYSTILDFGSRWR